MLEWSSLFIVLVLHCYLSCCIIVEMSVRNGCKIVVSVRIIQAFFAVSLR